MSLGTIRIAGRFSGPPNSANGGYACGRIAAFIAGPAEVTLQKPPPLDVEMRVHPSDAGGVELRNADDVIAYARPMPFTIGRSEAPSFDDSVLAASRTFDPSRHPLPTCFVCGPNRGISDGLRIHPGPVDQQDRAWTGLLAAPWIPDANLADESGIVRPEFVWAALDCPTAYAVSDFSGLRSVLLGRQTVRVRRLPTSMSRCVITARRTGREGRKFFAESLLLDENGQCMAECKAIWIEVTPAVQKGGLS